VDPLAELLVSGLVAVPRPWYSGAVGLIQHDGRVEASAAVGVTARDADLAGTPVPADLRQPVTGETVFDLASVTKLFVTTTVLSLVDEGRLALDEPIATWLPSFADGERRAVTLRHLLTHTAGLPSVLSLWTDWPDRPSRIAAVLNTPLLHPPGTSHEYSCVGYIVAGLLAEQVTGLGLAELVRDRVCAPLQLRDTGYLPAAPRERIAATEYQPQYGRGLVHGVVHDENSWSLGGVAGNAGIFGTAPDLARFGEMLRRGGELDGVRVLAAQTVAEMTRDQLPAAIDPGYRQGLGVRIGETKSAGALAADGAFGHGGFTGTSLLVDQRRGLVVVLLTNRVHPSREWSDVTDLRRAVADLAADRFS
jgi:CubicO group peptidase (beta-lactamase class C family)